MTSRDLFGHEPESVDVETVLLIDGDNMSPKCGPDLLKIAFGVNKPRILGNEVRIFGKIGTRTAWREVFYNRLVESETGKNSSDIALSMEALELALKGEFDRFYIASSDGDFSTIARKLSGMGVEVYGIGTFLASSEFVSACNGFFFLKDHETLAHEHEVMDLEEPDSEVDDSTDSQCLNVEFHPKHENFLVENGSTQNDADDIFSDLVSIDDDFDCSLQDENLRIESVSESEHAPEVEGDSTDTYLLDESDPFSEWDLFNQDVESIVSSFDEDVDSIAASVQDVNSDPDAESTIWGIETDQGSEDNLHLGVEDISEFALDDFSDFVDERQSYQNIMKEVRRLERENSELQAKALQANSMEVKIRSLEFCLKRSNDDLERERRLSRGFPALSLLVSKIEQTPSCFHRILPTSYQNAKLVPKINRIASRMEEICAMAHYFSNDPQREGESLDLAEALLEDAVEALCPEVSVSKDKDHHLHLRIREIEFREEAVADFVRETRNSWREGVQVLSQEVRKVDDGVPSSLLAALFNFKALVEQLAKDHPLMSERVTHSNGYRSLRAAGFKGTYAEIVSMSRSELLAINGIGYVTADALWKELRDMGFEPDALSGWASQNPPLNSERDINMSIRDMMRRYLGLYRGQEGKTGIEAAIETIEFATTPKRGTSYDLIRNRTGLR